MVGRVRGRPRIRAQLIVRLQATATGTIELDGLELLGLDERRRREIRGSEVGIVFQDALRALNPLLSIRRQMIEGPRHHLGLSRRAAEASASPAHPYTRALVQSIPRIDSGGQPDAEPIPGPPGARSGSDRMLVRIALRVRGRALSAGGPPLRPIADERVVACHHAEAVLTGCGAR